MIWKKKIWIYPTWGCFRTSFSLSFLAKWPFEKNIFFLNTSNIFSIIVKYCLSNEGVAFILRNFNSLYSIKICVNFDWNWPDGYGEEFKKIKKVTDCPSVRNLFNFFDRRTPQKTDQKSSLKLQVMWAKNEPIFAKNSHAVEIWIQIDNMKKFNQWIKQNLQNYSSDFLLLV